MKHIDDKAKRILYYMADPNKFLVLSTLDESKEPIAFREMMKRMKGFSPSALTYYVREGQRLGLLEYTNVKGDKKRAFRLTKHGKDVFEKYKDVVIRIKTIIR